MSGTPGGVLVQQPPLTGAGEVAAYAAAHVIKVAVAYAAAPFYAGALFQWAYGKGGLMAVTAVNAGQSVVFAAIGLALFVALRPSFGGVPAVVRAAGAGLTAGFEIGAYALAHVIGIVAGMVLFASVMPQLSAFLGSQGRSALLAAASIGLGAVIAAVAFVLFVYLRRGLAGRAATTI